MKKRSNFLIIAVVMLGLTTMLSSCGQTDKKAAIDKIKKSGEIVVATSGNQFPFSFKEDGVLKGIDIEIANKLAEDLGVKARFVEQDLSTIIDYVASNKADIAMSSLTVTEGRSKVVLFSEPYFVTGKGVLSKIKEVQEAKDLKGGEAHGEKYTIAVVDNSSSVDYAKKHYPKAHLILTKNINESREALYTGKVDGLLADYEICETLSFDKRNDGKFNFKRIGDAEEKQFISVAVAPSDTLLLKEINTLIHKIKKGEVDQMVEEKWMMYLN